MNLKRIILPIVLLGCIIAAIAANPDIQAVKGKVKDGYNFWLYTPPAAAADSDSTGTPLVIFLHGASLCGNNLDKVKRYGTIDAITMGRHLDAYVIAPQNPGGAWSPRRIMNIVDYVEKDHNIDTTRIYVLGMSLGGYGTLDLAATYPDRIAAAIAMCGGASVSDLSGLARLPLWIIHGTADRAVTVAQSDRVVQAVNSGRDSTDTVRLTYDRIKGMNHSRPARLFYRQDIYDWLMSHSLTDSLRAARPTFPLTEQVFQSAYTGLKAPARRSHRRHSRRRR